MEATASCNLQHFVKQAHFEHVELIVAHEWRQPKSLQQQEQQPEIQLAATLNRG